MAVALQHADEKNMHAEGVSSDHRNYFSWQMQPFREQRIARLLREKSNVDSSLCHALMLLIACRFLLYPRRRCCDVSRDDPKEDLWHDVVAD
ncbi:MAG TPA: hypothetical protein VD865_12705 [Stenotrophomonas sp.]|nr:hypothetical protein [Stenotrophomonas sp.]